MNRGKFIGIAGSAVCIATGAFYLLSDKHNFTRADIGATQIDKINLRSDEKEIIYLASLAPSGHNTQPWFINYLEPYHWIIGNDKSKWLPGVDSTQRETILSIGAFLQNLEYAANHFGYSCETKILATTNQDENIAEVKLTKSTGTPVYDIGQIKMRRTVRSGYLTEKLKPGDTVDILNDDVDFLHFFPNTSKEYNWLNEQTIEANRIQAYRDAAQQELANWIRFSSNDAEKYRDGLTTAGMEIDGVPGWVLRNFYGKKDVMKKNFREQTIDKAKEQVQSSAGWLLITSKDISPLSLIDTGKRLQRILLKIRKRNIAIHPMTQILEEADTARVVNQSISVNDPIQFILRTGYIKNYPDPVSLRRSPDQFVRT